MARASMAVERTALARLNKELEQEGAKTREQTETLRELGQKNVQTITIIH